MYIQTYLRMFTPIREIVVDEVILFHDLALLEISCARTGLLLDTAQFVVAQGRIGAQLLPPVGLPGLPYELAPPVVYCIIPYGAM